LQSLSDGIGRRVGEARHDSRQGRHLRLTQLNAKVVLHRQGKVLGRAQVADERRLLGRNVAVKQEVCNAGPMPERSVDKAGFPVLVHDCRRGMDSENILWVCACVVVENLEVRWEELMRREMVLQNAMGNKLKKKKESAPICSASFFFFFFLQYWACVCY
jgi:hypothetical protein